MINLTPKRLIKFVKDYDYEIDKSQALIILELLEEVYGIFESQEVVIATDYIVNGQESGYANRFE